MALRISWVAPLVGLIGGGAWIGICRLRLEASLVESLGLAEGWLGSMTARPAFDPWSGLGDAPLMLGLFLVTRFFGLVVLVPLIEEFFLRGFLVRFVAQPSWWTFPIGKMTPVLFLVVIGYAILSHPGELLAATVWFSLVTLLVMKTRSIWDAVLAHAVTNLTLGVYVVTWEDWTLW